MAEIIDTPYSDTLNCPVCDKKIVNWDEYKDGGMSNPCEHTLFIAFELGFEFCNLFMKDYLKSVINSDKIILDDEYLKFEFFLEQDYGLNNLEELEFNNLKILSVSTPEPHVETTFFGFCNRELVA